MPIELVNHGRDRITFGDKPGNPPLLILGSQDDKGATDAEGKPLPQPRVQVSAETYVALKKLKYFKGKLDARDISVYGA